MELSLSVSLSIYIYHMHIIAITTETAFILESADRVMMAAPSNELFAKCVEEAVRANVEFIPPYGSNGALYVRPLLFGSGPKIGLNPSTEYTVRKIFIFLPFVTLSHSTTKLDDGVVSQYY